MLESLFLEVSNPKSPKYGQYLTNDEVTSLVSAPAQSVGQVAGWLAAGGVDKDDIKLVGNGDLMTARMPVSVAESLFQVKLVSLQSKSGVKLIRSLAAYTVPEFLAPHLVFVEGLHRLPNLRVTRRTVEVAGEILRSRASSTDGNNVGWANSCGNTCAGMITPAVLRQRYNITREASTTTRSNQSVAEFQGQDLDPKDLAQFQSICNLPKQAPTIVGPNSPATGVESGLDIEYIMGVATNIPTTFWSLNQYSLYDWIEQVAGTAYPPLIHSVSYGNDEAQNGKAYMDKTNQEFAKMGVRGITVLFASGDQGAWGRAGELVFHPDFPAASPYITSVGATQFPGASVAQEICTDWSGGGFSKMFEPLPYQTAAIEGYFSAAASHLPPSYLWNKKGNGYPTLSANGGNNQAYCVIVGGAAQGVAGTSASCPTMAAMLALANDILFTLNKPPLGFVNQLIFSLLTEYPQAFDDIVVGKNSAGKIFGFESTKGWDPCSGVGNLNFYEFANYLVKA